MLNDTEERALGRLPELNANTLANSYRPTRPDAADGRPSLT